VDLWLDFSPLVSATIYYLVTMLIVLAVTARFRSPYFLVAFYITSYVVSQYTAPKLTLYAGFVVPGGTIPFVATLVLMDIIIVYWGLGMARQVIVAGFIAQILVYTGNMLIFASPDPFEGFEWKSAVYWVGARVAVASPVAYLVTELVNAQLTWIYRRLWWARTLYSDPIALVIDTLIFIPLAFYGEVPFEALKVMVAGQTALKLSFIPLNLAAIYVSRRIMEGRLGEHA